MTDQMMTTREVAAMLHVSTSTIKRLGDRREMRFYRVVGRGDRRYRPSDVSAYLERVAAEWGGSDAH